MEVIHSVSKHLCAFLELMGGPTQLRFRFVFPWLSPHHWELVELIRGAKPEAEAAKLATQQRIRHADVMRVRNATARAQGAMFAIIGGVAGITEGATLLGTLEAARGAEEGALAAMDLLHGGEHRAWSTRAIQGPYWKPRGSMKAPPAFWLTTANY